MSLKKLTKLEKWDSYYQNSKLPKKLNVKKYEYYLFDKFFKSHLDKGKKRILEVGCGFVLLICHIFIKNLGIWFRLF